MKINKKIGIPFLRKQVTEKQNTPLTTTNGSRGMISNVLQSLSSQGRALLPSQKPTKAKLLDKITKDEEISSNIQLKNYVNEMMKLVHNQYQIQLADKILSTKELYANKSIMQNIEYIMFTTNSKESADAKCFMIDKILTNEVLRSSKRIKRELGTIIQLASESNVQYKTAILDKISSDEKIYNNESIMSSIDSIVRFTTDEDGKNSRLALLDKLFNNENISSNKEFVESAGELVCTCYSMEKYKMMEQLIDKIFSDSRLYENKNFMKSIGHTISKTRDEEEIQPKLDIIDKILSDERLYKNQNIMDSASIIIEDCPRPHCTEYKTKLIDTVLSIPELYDNEEFMSNAGTLIASASIPDTEFICELLTDKRLYKYPELINNVAEIAKISHLIYNQNFYKKALLDKILSNEELCQNNTFMKEVISIIQETNTEEGEIIADTIISDERLYDNELFLKHAKNILHMTRNKEKCSEYSKILKNKDILPNQMIFYIDKSYGINEEEINKLNSVIGKEAAGMLNDSETIIALKFMNLYKKQNINEIPASQKRQLLKNLVSANQNIFSLSESMKQLFPILPQNQEEYCSLLPSIVRSLGIETKNLSDLQLKQFDITINSLANILETMSDKEFNNIKIEQEYSRHSFIEDVIDKTKNLEEEERQKVYDYFGFELKENNNASTKIKIDGTEHGFTIVGYPRNINNGEKLSQIKDIETKNVIETLRSDVIKFSENNHIKCNNILLEDELNNIVSIVPEIRTEIDNIQAGMNGTKGSHEFDIMKHSLKVMQKIVQNIDYHKLNKSDKKLLLIASLFHDITKKEGYTDSTHAENSSFDTFFICNKFKLTQDEQIKLYSLIKHHEWLGKVNTSKNSNELKKNIQSVAYDLRHDNLFDMSLIFTHADLKAVKTDDSFHDKRDGKGRTDFFGITRSFGESADYYGILIKKLIKELQITQPLLPVTKFPKASTIDKAITTVNDDGSTNIKGIYKDKNGLVIIKFNEIENWEEIGFEKGSTSSGINCLTEKNEEVDTGNIKFFAHGLDYPNQLSKFDAFSLVDSNALLSVSYAERPESKYRFFRPQGVILDCDTKYVHGGGKTDSGSGCGKSIQTFKNEYIFGGRREDDRKYISNLIKETTGMDDIEYVNFVKENENKSFNELEPAGLREKIIKAFSGINSNKRTGMREYNEMYISNPKPPMAVFAYNMNDEEEIGNPIEFLSRTSIDKYEIDKSVFERTEFLQKYALERDIPFVVFGD